MVAISRCGVLFCFRDWFIGMGYLGMSVVAVVTTRSQSTRFPNKFQADICGKPMLLRIVEEVRQAQVDDVVVAGVMGDKPVIKFCEKYDIWNWSGEERDVLGRVYRAASSLGALTVVRIWGDSPLISHYDIDFAFRYYDDVRPRYLTAMFDSGAVAVTSITELQKLDKRLKDPKDREWIHTYQSKQDGATEIKLGTPVTLDTPEELENICKLWKLKKS